MTYFEHLMQDLNYAWRMLRRAPGFAAIAVATLALGIGVNTAIFSTVDSAMLRALPYGDPERVVFVWEDGSFVGFGKNTPAPGNFAEWRRRNQVFTDMAATRSVSANLTADGPPELAFGRQVTANFFSVLGVRPILGRTFTEMEEQTKSPVAVISYALWRRRYGGDPQLAGKQILMDGRKVTVLGVMPEDFALVRRDVAYWMPISFSAADLENRGSHYLNVVARLKPGVALARAQDDMRAVAARMSAEYQENQRVGAVVVGVKEELLGSARTGLLVLMAAAGCVLLIACANLASLLLARSVARQREISIRVALGAGRTRLVRQMITEGLMLALAGGALSLAIVPAGIQVLEKLVPATLPASALPQADGRLLVFAMLLSFATGLLFSLIPALQTARRSPIEALKQDGRAGTGDRGHAIRDALVVAEVALALVLLIGAGLMLQTLARLQSLTLGFRPDHLLTLRTVLPPKYGNLAVRTSFTNRVLEGVRTLPGVLGAGYASTLPFESRGDTTGYAVEGRQFDANDPHDALYRVVSEDYLQVLGVRLVEGRFFNRGDGPSTTPVVIINEKFARQYWPKESAVGRRISLTYDDPSVWHTVIGVVGDVRERGHEPAMKPGVYQLAAYASRQTRELILRTAGDPMSLVPAVRRVIASVDPEQSVTWVRSMDEMVDLDVADRQQQLTLLGAFAVLALVLASVGLYGVLSYVVSQRSREIGMRMALGASGGSVVRMVVGRGLTLTAIGLVIGLAASIMLTRLMENLLYGVGANDPATFAGVAAVLGLVAAVACWIPAKRASRMDPMVVLREE